MEEFPEKVFEYIFKSLEETKFWECITYNTIMYEGTEDAVAYSCKKAESVTDTDLYKSLDSFFISNPGSYFIRDNVRSPKDAYYFVNETANVDNLDDIIEIMGYLKVSSAMDCIDILITSGRFYEDLHEYGNIKGFSIVLLPWKDIDYQTETRCFIHNNNVIAVSQYYDLVVDHSITDRIAELLPEFIINNVFADTNRSTCVVDVYLKDNDTLEIIEFNPFNQDVDTCLFTWDEIQNIIDSGIYKQRIEYRR